MKTCLKCKLEKEPSEFKKDTKCKDGLRNICKPCTNLITKVWAERNREKVREANKVQYYKNKEKVLERQKDWQLNNKDKTKVIQKRYSDNNPDKLRQKRSNYLKLNPSKFCHYSAKRRAIKLQQTPSWVTQEELKQIEALYLECSRLTKETGIQYHVDHYYPLNSSKGSGLHCLANLRIITATENLAKKNTWPE
jgi:hypothetical protein